MKYIVELVGGPFNGQLMEWDFRPYRTFYRAHHLKEPFRMPISGDPPTEIVAQAIAYDFVRSHTSTHLIYHVRHS